MANLFEDFGFKSTEDENVTATSRSPYSNSDGDTTVYDQFITLFGTTSFKKGGYLGFGDNALNKTSAFFGSDLDGDGIYNVAQVTSDWVSQDQLLDYKATMIRNDTLSATFKSQVSGIALTRQIKVNSPETFGLLTFTLLFCVRRYFL